MCVQLLVVVTGCVPMSVVGGVGIRLRDGSFILDQLALRPRFCDCSLNIKANI